MWNNGSYYEEYKMGKIFKTKGDRFCSIYIENEFYGYAHKILEAREVIDGILDGKDTYTTKSGYLRLK